MRSPAPRSVRPAPTPARLERAVRAGRAAGLPPARAPRRRDRAPLLLGGLLAGAAGAYAALCGYLVLRLTRAARVPFTRTPDQFGLRFEEVAFHSREDHLPLHGWLLWPPDGAPRRRPIVVLHGKGGDRQHGQGQGLLAIVAPFVQAGHPVLTFDMRGSGLSGGERFTLGAREVRDAGGAVDLLARRGLLDRGVALLGFSMGGATALLFAASEPLVRAVVVDSAFADLADVLRDQVPRHARMPRFVTPGVILMARPLMGLDARAVRPAAAVPLLAARDVPLLLVHGTADETVPFHHARRLAAAYGPGVETYTVEGASHAGIFDADPPSYLARVLDFLQRAEAR